MNRLVNIFINTQENKLRLAEVFFSNKIKEIKYLSDELEWSQINTKDLLIEFKRKYNTVENDEKVFDGEFSLLMPGAIDPHVHFDTPGFEFREDFRHASTAAAFGGVTTIIDMPCTSIPPVTNVENLNVKLEAVENESLIDFAFWGGIRGQDFDDPVKLEKQITDLSEAGVAGFKAYVISGMDEFSDLTYAQIQTVAQIVEKTGKHLAIHAEDKSMIISKRDSLKKENKNNWQDYCDTRNDESESVAIERIRDIAESTGCRIHIVHLSSKKGLEIVVSARKDEIQLTAETCPHYLYFTQNDFKNDNIRSFLKTAPPVKNDADKNALWEVLKNNALKFITTDHAGCDPSKEKTSENFWKVYGGIPGVEHRVPFLFSEGFLKNRISLEQTINYLSTNAAEFFSIKDKGKLETGYDADFAQLNLWDSQKISANEMHSKGKYTPFENFTFNSVVEKTFLRGNLIMNKSNNSSGEIGYGEFIRV